MQAGSVKSDLNVDSEATAATVTIGGNKPGYITIHQIHVAYDVVTGLPKRMTITVDGTIRWAQAITGIGPQVFDFGPRGWVISLAQDGAGCVISAPAEGTSGTICDLNVIGRF